MEKSKAQNHLYKATIAAAFNLPVGTTFTFRDLSKYIYFSCSTNDQRLAGQRFAYLVKHANVPFIIIDPVSPIVYQRIQGGN
ncbi:cassette chromosome ssDNA-binding protein [Mammaliicoccus sciuri]|uniref:cassette chromosome ssDNA-binding protein n=1 Tax=Mammaliicoccus sciuri TaxID=1296 RepID=UPI002DBFC13B|nr:DUF1413 domain-containing protein [Mammaliicoccus sciuri]MEB8208773.1 single-stranded DNA-binding protein [Mammaliicoccus sciuri]